MLFRSYMHTNKINNKVYVGQTCKTPPEKRWANGVGYRGSSYFYNAIQKYGWDNFEHIIFADNLSQQEACATERLLIALYQTNDSNYGYNLSSGGEKASVGVCRSQEFKNNLSKLKTGTHISKEAIEKIKRAKTGKKLTSEEKAARKEKMKQYHNPFLGKEHTNDAKQKMSETKSGKYLGHNNANARAYYCIELNEIFISARDVYEKYGISSSHICSCCNGSRKSCGKHPITGEPLHWKTVEDAISLSYITQEQFDTFKTLIKQND